MKQILTGFFLLFSLAASAQRVVNVDKANGVPVNSFYTIEGNPVSTVRFVRLTDGTPYFRDQWMRGQALSVKDVPYRNAQVKLDLLEGELHFLNSRNEELVCTIPLKELTLTDTVSGASFHFVNAAYLPALAAEKKGWCLQLAEGRATLYQAFTKKVTEYKPYNSPVAEQRIATSEEFLLAGNGILLRAKKPKDLPALFPDKKAEMEAFLKSDAMQAGSTAERMTALVKHYNSLH